MAISTIGQNGLQQSQILTAAQMPTGSTLQVVSATNGTPTQSTSTSFVQTNLTASITPKFSNSRIMVLVSTSVYFSSTSAYAFYSVYRNNTTNLGSSYGLAQMSCPALPNVDLQLNIMTIDSPATTSSTSYTLWVRAGGSGNTITNDNLSTNTIILMEIAG
jgi:hypothetical protein